MEHEHLVLVEALKKVVKNKGFTYKTLAKKLDLTEAVIKNMFYNKSISLARFIQLCNAVGISLSELSEVAGIMKSQDFSLSCEAEQYFIDNPKDFQFFRELVLHEKSIKEVQKRLRLSRQESFMVLRKFERFGLVEILSDENVHLKVRGRLKWRVDGPWYKKYFVSITKETAVHLLNKWNDPSVYHSLGAFSLSSELLTEFYRDLDKLLDYYKDQAFRIELFSDSRQLIFVGWNMMILPTQHPSLSE